MILVSVSSSNEKFRIFLKHNIVYVVEKKFSRTLSLSKRTSYVLRQLFVSITKLIFIEIFARVRK